MAYIFDFTPIMETRLNKALSLLGICSRREGEKLIVKGLISVNNEVVTTMGTKIHNSDIIRFNNINYSLIESKNKPSVWKYYKKIGTITTHRDPQGRPTVFDDVIPRIGERVVSVGRLDINSEGLLLLTNSNAFANMAESPKNKWQRVYKVRIFGELTEKSISTIEKGITIDSIKYAPMKIEIIANNKKNIWCKCTLSEGKNREIRKIFAFFGLIVNRLIRIQYGQYTLDSMNPGEILKIANNKENIFKNFTVD